MELLCYKGMIMNNMQICISEKLYLEYPMVHVSLCNALERSNVKYQILYCGHFMYRISIQKRAAEPGEEATK